jgi:acyl-CoA reductase-like NAD-dependent aldehyde dehydrogenase
MYIAGEWVDAHSGETFESVDPFTGRPWAVIPRAGPEDVDDAVQAARRAFDDGPWRRTTAVERGRMMRRLGELIPSTPARWPSWRASTTAS